MDFEILAQHTSSGMAALFAALVAMLIWQLRVLAAGQKQLQKQLHEQTASLSAKIDDTRKELSAKIDGVRKDLNAKIDANHEAAYARMDEHHRQLDVKIDEVRKGLSAKIDANHEAAYARMDEHHRQTLALYQGLAAAVERLDGKVEAMSEFLRALLGGKALQDIAARRQAAGKAA